MTSLGDSSSFKEKMIMLGRSYKHSKAYQIFGEKHYCNPYETHVEKYEPLKFQSEKSKL